MAIELSCAACGVRLAADRVNRAARLAQCVACASVTELAANPASAGESGVVGVAPLPHGVPIAVTETALAVRVPRRGGALAKALVVVVIVAAVGVGLGLGLLSDVFLYIAPVLLIVAYAALARGLGRVAIAASSRGLTIRRSPLPVPGGHRQIPAAVIAAVHASKGRGGDPTVVAEVEGGQPLVLPIPLTDTGEARYLANAFARTLGLAETAEAPAVARTRTAPAAASPESAQIPCPVCRQPIEHVHLTHGLALCGSCRVLIDLAHDPRSRAPGHALVPLTLEFQVRADGMRVAWRRKPRGLPVWIVLLTAWTVFWVAQIVRGSEWKSITELGAWGPPVMVSLSVAGLYFLAAPLVNRVVLRAQRGLLAVSHAPLPYPGDRQWRAKDVQELACETRTHRSRPGGGRQATRLFVVGRRPDGREQHTDLVDHIPDEEFGVFLLRAIERVVDIPRAPSARAVHGHHGHHGSGRDDPEESGSQESGSAESGADDRDAVPPPLRS